MSSNSDSSGRHRAALDGPARAVVGGTLFLLAWGVLAFGSPYPWAYTPLAIGAALVGLLAWSASQPTRLLSDQRRLLAGLVAVAVATAVQLLPLPAGLVDTISPANAIVLEQIDLMFASAVAAVQAGTASALPYRPLSIDPARTTLGLLLLIAFGLLLGGLLRHCNRFGARRFAAFFVAFGALVAVVGIVQKATLGDNVAGGMRIYGFWSPIVRLTTPFGPFVNKNHFAGWMLMALPMALGYLLAQADVAFRRVRPGWRHRFLWLSSPEGGRLQIAAFAVVVMGASLLMTLSRSGIGCFGVAMVIATVAAARRQRSMQGRFAVVLGIGLLVAVPVLWANTNLSARISSQDSSLRLRRQIWSDTGRLIHDFPLAGTGLDTFAVAMRVYQSLQADQAVREAHNDYLQLVAEGGLLAGVPIAITLVTLMLSMRRRLAVEQDDPATSWIRFGAATGLVAIALQSLVEFSLQMPGIAVTFVVLVAVALHRPSAVPPAVHRL